MCLQLLSTGAKSRGFVCLFIVICNLFDCTPLCVFKCALKLYILKNELSQWLHLFDFLPQCVFKCLLK